MDFIKHNLLAILLFIFCSVILVLSLRGIPGDPGASDLNTAKWRNDGPFEQTGRFALLYSVLEEHTFQFPLSMARFASPDLATVNKKFVSLFAPGISFIVMPGYLLGKYFDLSQVGTFAVISVFALFNAVLLRLICIRLGVNRVAAALSAVVFLFATPAFAYSVDLFQHQVTVFLMLMSIYSLLGFPAVPAILVTWFLCAASVTIDYPNLFLMAPLGLAAFARMFVVKNSSNKIVLNLNIFKPFTMIIMIFPVLFLLWFNSVSFGNPFTLSGELPRVENVDKTLVQFKQPVKSPDSHASAVLYFSPRAMFNGLYIHLVSPDRGIIFYTPVVLFGLPGIYYAYKKKKKYTSLFVGIIGIDLLLYSMWGDPWGGWSFGSRYLIPAYALLSIFTGYTLTYIRKNIFLLLFLAVFSYSSAVNTLGALTSSLIPPKIEADVLSRTSHREEKYTLFRDVDFLSNHGSKSFVYQAFADNYLTPWDYYIDITLLIVLFGSFLIFYQKADEGKERHAVVWAKKEHIDHHGQ